MGKFKEALMLEQEERERELGNMDDSDYEEKVKCEHCNDTGEIEIMGDGANFEWDVVDVKKCGWCQDSDE